MSSQQTRTVGSHGRKLLSRDSLAGRDGIGCFIAGTLVHAERGLVPIEQIQTGDRVRCKPETRAGNISFQRVIRTSSIDNREVWHLVYQLDDTAGYAREDWLDFVVATTDHMFWVASSESWSGRAVSGEWLRADCVFPGAHLTLVNGKTAMVVQVAPVLRTARADVGFIRADRYDVWEGATLDLTGPRPVSFPQKGLFAPGDAGLVPNDLPEWMYLEDSDAALKRRVYNLEVQDEHAYFVGQHGVWVHDAPAVVGDLDRF